MMGSGTTGTEVIKLKSGGLCQAAESHGKNGGRVAISYKLPADDSFSFAVWELWMGSGMPFMLKYARGIPNYNATGGMESCRSGYKIDSSAVAPVYGCLVIEPHCQLIWIRDCLPDPVISIL